MTFVVLFILAVVWAVYFFSWLRSRSEHRSVNSISSFSKHLTVLERTSPARLGVSAVPSRRQHPLAVPTIVRRRVGMTVRDAQRRRRDVLFGLAGATLVTLMLTVVAASAFAYLFVVCVVLLVAYVGMLVQTQRIAAERRAKVRYLHAIADEDEEQTFLLQHSASAH